MHSSGRNAPGRRTAVCLAAALLASCGSKYPPSILTIPDQVGRVNTLLSFDVAATDEDTESLVFTMSGAPQGASLRQIAGKIARFDWTPNPAQSGFLTVTFVADDGTSKDTETAGIKIEGGTPPTLASPDRYLYDVASNLTVKFVLVVRDDDAPTLDTTLDPDPQEWGATVELSEDGKRVSFIWQPSADQMATAQHHFVLRSADVDGVPLERAITIIFRGGSGGSCPTGKHPPQISAWEIPPQAGTEPYEVWAEATDVDSSVASVSVKWTTVPEPRESDWRTEAMEDVGDGYWGGLIPNLQLAEGESAEVTWKVCAVDADSTRDECNHSTCTEPDTFTASASAALCDPCQAGGCGSTGVCLETGAGEAFCGQDCGTGGSCPGGFSCAEIGLSGGGTRNQCIPEGCVSHGANDPSCSCAAGRPVAPQAGELVVNEVLYDPPDSCPPGQTTCDTTARLVMDVNGDGVRKKYTDEGDEEFVEILNRSSRYLQLQGVQVSDSEKVRFTFPATVLPPGRAALVFGGGDPSRFGSLGNSLRFSSSWNGGQVLSLNNDQSRGDTVKLSLPGASGEVVLDRVQYTGVAGKNQSLVRMTEGNAAASLVSHSTAANSAGARYSPGTHTCGVTFPLDAEACVPPACTYTNQNHEPENNSRSTAPCLDPLPQTVSGTLVYGQTDPAQDNARDLFVILRATGGHWLHAHTEAGAAPGSEDTFLRLLARNGTQIAANDDDPWEVVGFYSRLIVQFPADGVYYLEVTPLEPTAAKSGSYRLVVESSATEPQAPSP